MRISAAVLAAATQFRFPGQILVSTAAALASHPQPRRIDCVGSILAGGGLMPRTETSTLARLGTATTAGPDSSGLATLSHWEMAVYSYCFLTIRNWLHLLFDRNLTSGEPEAAAVVRESFVEGRAEHGCTHLEPTCPATADTGGDVAL